MLFREDFGLRTLIRILAAFALLAIAVLGGFASHSSSSIANRPSGWGIDACLSCHVLPREVPAYLRMLERESRIVWLRERGLGKKDEPQQNGDSRTQKLSRRNADRISESQDFRLSDFPASRVWAAERRAGFRVVAFAGAPARVERPFNQLPEDLLAVYLAHCESARATTGLVDAWEMVGEPDALYCRDLPDRVAAYQKAVYLGLKVGAISKKLESQKTDKTSIPQSSRLLAIPAVLMGALAYPPGPWLDLAARNGLYYYTDAINIHHYGFASEMAALIDAHREFSQFWSGGRTLPVWVTEAGHNNIPRDDWGDPVARAEQADYLLECARQAIIAKAAVFMPFILVWRGEPFGMTESARDVHPAWARYAAFTRANRLVPPGGIFAQPPPTPCPVVLQWLPAAASALPSKVTRSYWFRRDAQGVREPMRGELRIYNLSPQAQDVRLEPLAVAAATVRVEGGGAVTLRVPSFTRVTRLITITPPVEGYARVALRGFARVGKNMTTGVEFVVETPAGELTPRAVVPLTLADPGTTWNRIGGPAPVTETSRRAPWLGLNGVFCRAPAADGSAEFFVCDRNLDAVTPPMAVAATPAGLPGLIPGFLRLRVINPAGGDPPLVRVDLVDRDGQRWSLVENFGRNYFRDEGDTVLLGYADFHPWVFGRVHPFSPFDPAAIREIQLRFVGAGASKAYRVRLDAVSFPKATPGDIGQ